MTHEARCVTGILNAALATVFFLAIAAEASLACTPSVESPSPAPTLSPRELFRRTFVRLETYSIPPYVLIESLWQVRPNSNLDNREFDVVWRYAVRDSDGAENASILKIARNLPTAYVGKKSIGLFATILRPPQPVEMPAPAEDSDLKTIAVVAATNSDYRMDLVGEETVDGHMTDHVRLTPLRNLPKYNLRDLWIDTQTFDLRRAAFVFLGRPDDPLRNGATITVDFGPAQQYWIVLRSTWFTARNIFKLTTIRVLIPTILPDWLFDQSAYDQHRKAGELDPLEELLNATSSPSPLPRRRGATIRPL